MLIRIIKEYSSYYHVFLNKDRIHFCISKHELDTPNKTSVSFNLQDYNQRFYTCFKRIDDIVQQFRGLDNYLFIKFLSTIIEKTDEPTLTFGIAQTMFGEHLSKDFDPKMTKPVAKEFSASISTYRFDNIIVTIIVESNLFEENLTTIVAFDESFLPILFNTRIEFVFKDVLKKELNLTKKFIDYYLHFNPSNSEKLDRELKTIVRKAKIAKSIN